MKIIYKRLWDIGDTDSQAVMTIEQDWVPHVGTTVYFPDNTCGTIVDLAMRYTGGKEPQLPYVEVWLK